MSSPTKSLCGPTSTEFQFHEFGDGKFVKPSWCLLVRTTYLVILMKKCRVKVIKIGYKYRFIINAISNHGSINVIS